MCTGDVYECVTTWNHYDKTFVVVRRQQLQLRYRPKSNNDISLMCLVRQFDCVMCWIDLLRHTVRHNLYLERIINKNNQIPHSSCRVKLWKKCRILQREGVRCFTYCCAYGCASAPLLTNTELYYFLSRYCTAHSNHIFIMSPPTSLLTYLQKWRQILLNRVDGRFVVVFVSE